VVVPMNNNSLKGSLAAGLRSKKEHSDWSMFSRRLLGEVLFMTEDTDYISRTFTAGTAECNYEYCINLDFEEGEEVRVIITETGGSTQLINQWITSAGSYCFDINQYGNGTYEVQLHPNSTVSLTVSAESVSWISLPAFWEEANACTGSTANGGLSLYYHSGASAQHEISTTVAIDSTCTQSLCFSISDLSGTGELVVQDQNGDTLSSSNIVANGEHCISYSNIQADSLRFSYRLTTGSTMTLKRFELVEQCDDVLLVANVLNSQDYYPFGMVMPGRSFQGSDGYRYGFNAMERDDEVAGNGNSYTAPFWQYDSRVVKRWNIDPVVKVFESPYAALANNPVWFTDPSGADTTVKTSTARKTIAELLDPKNREVYGDEIPFIINTAILDTGVSLTFTDNVKDLPHPIPALAKGAMIKVGENDYIIYWDNTSSNRQIGASPLIEELFHFSNAYYGRANYTQNLAGKWGIHIPSDLLDEEARAKHQVITLVPGISQTYWEPLGPMYPNYYAKVNTYYGHMQLKHMSHKAIRLFISSGKGTLYKWPLYEYSNGNFNPLTGGNLPVNIPGQGAY